MEDALLTWGYPTLFILSFLAATVLPLGSEWLLAVLLAHGYRAEPVVLVATVGNSLGALTTWGIGVWGSDWLVTRVLRIDSEVRRRAEGRFERWGNWILLLSWLPVVGDPLCLAAGLLRVHWLRFILPVLCGKLGRYAMVAGLVSIF
ncbi:MAG: hypothetical protein C0624_05695 [Desulfuromonas sp.]|nr:MAG: hypothetical protein C0624_05695 [Desulfuromonas sp.]